MDWWKTKSRAVVKKQRLERGQRRGEKFLKELIECCDGKPNPIKFFSADQILKATEKKHICKCNILERSQNVCECSRVSELHFHERWHSGMLDNQYRSKNDCVMEKKNEDSRGDCNIDLRQLYIQSRSVGENRCIRLFGVFMQKLLTGEERFDELCGWKNWREKNKFPKWLSKVMGEGRMDEIVVDPNMLEKMSEISEEERCQMEAFLVLSERCIGLRGEVLKMVERTKEISLIFL